MQWFEQKTEKHPQNSYCIKKNTIAKHNCMMYKWTGFREQNNQVYDILYSANSRSLIMKSIRWGYSSFSCDLMCSDKGLVYSHSQLMRGQISRLLFTQAHFNTIPLVFYTLHFLYPSFPLFLSLYCQHFPCSFTFIW